MACATCSTGNVASAVQCVCLKSACDVRAACLLCCPLLPALGIQPENYFTCFFLLAVFAGRFTFLDKLEVSLATSD